MPADPGFGVAFLFIPVSALAYSYLPKELNNKASSLTNLFRISAAASASRSSRPCRPGARQVHQNFLIEHLGVAIPAVQTRLHDTGLQFMRGGYTAVDSTIHAQALLASNMANQAGILGFLDVFWMLGWISAGSALLALLIRPFNPKGGAPAAE